MENEPKTIQQKLAGIVEQLEINGRYCQELAAELPAVIAEIEPGEKFDLVMATFLTFRDTWKNQADVERLFRCLCVLFERDATRRALMEAHEVGSLERIGEL
jgi:hypothetical protein